MQAARRNADTSLFAAVSLYLEYHQIVENHVWLKFLLTIFTVYLTFTTW